LQEAKGNQPYLRIFEAEDFKSFLPIIYNIRKVKITESYHKNLGLARIRDTMAYSSIPGGMGLPQYVGYTSRQGAVGKNPETKLTRSCEWAVASNG
jgi:hypothetical protein